MIKHSRIASRLILVTGVVLLASFASFAQDTPKAEVFGGYSYFRSNPADGYSMNMNGWTASVTGYVNKWFGITGEAGGYYKKEGLSIGSTTLFGESNHVYTFMGGPTIASHSSKTFTPFAHALFGIASKKGSPEILGLSFSTGSDNGFAMAVGGGVDINMSKNVAIRVIQADYIMDRVGGIRNDNARVSAGIVFRFGK